MRRYLTLLISSTVLLTTGSISSRAAPDAAASAKSRLMLTVTLDSIYNNHFQVDLPVVIDQPFKVVTTNGSVTNTMSGTVGKPVQGKYPLPLYVSEAAGGSGMKGTSDYSLELGKPVSGRPVASFVFIRTVQLSKVP